MRKDNQTKHKTEESTNSLYIREMRIEDLAGVFTLGEKIFTAEKWPNLYRTWDEYEVAALFASDSDFCLTAFFDDQLVGFTMGTLIYKRRSAWTYGYLQWIGVEPEAARFGVGTKLADELTEIFIDHGARIMIVDTQESNKAAIQFFGKLGFGNENRHVYLSRNLSNHEYYLKHKQKDQT
jgi:ribosomal protein S18 acetylase RimI-like enzyme